MPGVCVGHEQSRQACNPLNLQLHPEQPARGSHGESWLNGARCVMEAMKIGPMALMHSQNSSLVVGAIITFVVFAAIGVPQESAFGVFPIPYSIAHTSVTFLLPNFTIFLILCCCCIFNGQRVCFPHRPVAVTEQATNLVKTLCSNERLHVLGQ